MKPAPNKSDRKTNGDMTPMIDCVFLLIVFFIMNQFKLVEGHLDIFLPKDSGITTGEQKDMDELRLTVRSEGEHWIMRIGGFVVGRYPRDMSKWALAKEGGKAALFNNVIARLETDIRDHLSRRLDDTPEGQRVVIDIDGEAPYLFAVQLMNECKARGLADIVIKGPEDKDRLIYK